MLTCLPFETNTRHLLFNRATRSTARYMLRQRGWLAW